MVLVRFALAALGGLSLGVALAHLQTINSLKKEWHLVDRFTGEVLDINDQPGELVSLPLGDSQVEVRYRGKWQAAWEEIGPQQQQGLIRRQAIAAWVGLVLVVSALAPIGVRGSLIIAVAAAAGGLLVAWLLNKTGVLLPGTGAHRRQERYL